MYIRMCGILRNMRFLSLLGTAGMRCVSAAPRNMKFIYSMVKNAASKGFQFFQSSLQSEAGELLRTTNLRTHQLI